MSGGLCARCGDKAKGYATIGDKRYCHGDQERPTCYMQESWERTRKGLNIGSVAPFSWVGDQS